MWKRERLSEFLLQKEQKEGADHGKTFQKGYLWRLEQLGIAGHWQRR